MCHVACAVCTQAFRGHIEISRILLKTFYERFLEPMMLAQVGDTGGAHDAGAGGGHGYP